MPRRVIGLLLAAGSGRRYGTPKALVDTGDGPWVLRALDTLSGCSSTVVVAGAAADVVTTLVGDRSTVVVNPAFAEGIAGSLMVGLSAVTGHVDAVLVMLVDLPDVSSAVVARLLDEAGTRPRTALLRASYSGLPGHPVLIGADHLGPFRSALALGEPDAGGATYLKANSVRLIECGDLATGVDVDRPAGTPEEPARSSSRPSSP